MFDEERMELWGEVSKKTYRLGQKISVAVAGADRKNRTIDFVPEVSPQEDVAGLP